MDFLHTYYNKRVGTSAVLFGLIRSFPISVPAYCVARTFTHVGKCAVMGLVIALLAGCDRW